MGNLLAFSVGSLVGDWIIPITIVFLVIAFFVTIKIMASRYIKIGPTEAGIFYGAGGYRVVTGGGKILWPIVQNVQIMSTAATQVKIDEKDIPNKDNVKISAKGVATFKIEAVDTALNAAAAAFLGKSNSEIAVIVTNILQGHLRSIIGKLDINEILRDRDAFNRKVVDESTSELNLLGIKIMNMVITEVTDEYGYIDALGKKAVAEAIRDAEIKSAQAHAETQKQVSDAQREASITVAQNAVKVAEAEKNRNVQVASFKVTSDTEKAKADKALEIATAAQEKILKVAQAQRDAAEKEAQIEISLKEAERKEAELVASVVKLAEAEKKKTVIAAEAAKQQQILEAEAAKEVQVRMAEADQKSKVLEGEGEASRARAIGEGQAAATEATLTAKAKGEAAQKGLVLKAEAEGTQKLAEALAKMTDSAKLILILDRLPVLIDKGGDAGAKIAKEIFTGCAAPLAGINDLRIVDFGGNGDSVKNIGTLVPSVVAEIVSKLKATGVDVTDIASKCGIDISKLSSILGGQDTEKTVEE